MPAAPPEPPTAIDVRVINAEQTRPMRIEVLRPAAERDELVFDGDDDECTLHVGAYLDGELVGITSVYEDPRAGSPTATRGEWRLRGVATAAQARRMGVASTLAARCLEHVRAHGGHLLWCNARTPAVPFYEAHGFELVDQEFEIPGAGPHYVMQRPVD